MAMNKILLILSSKYLQDPNPNNTGDESYIQRLGRVALNGAQGAVYKGKIETRSALDILAAKVKATCIATTREDIVRLLTDNPKAKLANYVGSVFETPGGLEVVVLPPLKQLITVSYGEWLSARLLSKVLKPQAWRTPSEFRYKILNSEEDYRAFYNQVADSFLCSIDIETAPPCTIRSVSYTLAHYDNTTSTGVFWIDSLEKVEWMRKLNATPVAKVCQNGKYECAHFFAWGTPMVNYIADTLNAMHCTWSELPKDLNFTSSLFNRKHMYWKDLNEQDLLHYNALDTWQTLEAFLAWLDEAPKYAKDNYILKFPQVYISHEMEMRGLKRDVKRKERWHKVKSYRLGEYFNRLEKLTGVKNFNPNSPKQVQSLLYALGMPQGTSSGEIEMKKAILLHPLNEAVLSPILDYRGESKLVSTYLPLGDKDKDYRGRWLYGIHPHGTDTGRDASSEHHFWCGQNVQNVPNEAWQIKNTVVADEGFELYEADFEQAEARGVAYCSGDKALLDAVNSGRDFHSVNASAFFGVPYEDIYDDTRKATKNKPLRNLSKRVNHGANYNMGPGVLLNTMGEKAVREAQRLLHLDPRLSLLKVCEYLLQTYEVTYPRVKGAYYNSIIREVRTTSKLVGPTGWTRYCFGKPWENKLDLNGYVAHVTQSLNALILDEAALRIFRWRVKEQLLNVVKINAKIHDSILFQVPIGRKDLAEKVRDLMLIPTPIKDCLGVERIMTVPSDLSYCGRRWEMFQ